MPKTKTLLILSTVAIVFTLAVWNTPVSAAPPEPLSNYIRLHSVMANIKYCESRGNYEAINESDSEYHPEDGTTGSYGAYQIWPALWKETVLKYFPKQYSAWSLYRPDQAPPIIQDLVAGMIYWRLDTIAWKHNGNC